MPLLPSEVLCVNPSLELVATGPERGLSRGVKPGAQVEFVQGDVDALLAVLEAVAADGNVAAVVRRLSARMSEAAALATLEQLRAAGWLVREQASAAQVLPRVALIGNGRLADAIARVIAQQGFVELVRSEPLALPRASDPGARRFPALGGVRFVPAARGESQAPTSDVTVLALDRVTYAELDAYGEALNARGEACLFVSVEAGEGRIGPLMLAGGGSGFVASRHRLATQGGQAVDREALQAFSVQELGSSPAELEVAERVSRELALELRRIVARDETPRSLDSVLLLTPSGSARQPLSLVSEPAQPSAASASSGRDLSLEADVIAARATNLRERGERPLSTTLRRVGIVGGGTAGYLTALALRAKLPELEVTLIESSTIPIIGVGEATTALLNHFLHAYLGLDILDFYARVEPTWKLGIRFEWGLPGDYFYNSPFQFGKLLESLVYEGDINKNCLGSRLMTANTTPVVRTAEGGHRCLLSEVPYAYHLDNRRFVRYLTEEARRAGVLHLDTVVDTAVPLPDRSGIDYLLTEDGRELRYDLYIDCTGFRSLLLDKALGSPFVSYASSLFADSAVVANVPHGGLVKPYTVAETMDHGWCWNIPMPDSDHRGYVYSSAFANLEQASAEMRAKNPGMAEPWTVRFRSGRHEEFWRGNCVAIGNSFAFVEPLQSTAIHMIVVEIQRLVSAFPREGGLRCFQPLINREINEVWDTLRWFLAAHYRFNRRLDTPFWRECRARTNTSGVDELLALYGERAPLGATAHRLRELDLSTFGVYRYDLLFMGMGLEAPLAVPDDDELTWRLASAATERVAARALPFGAALEVLQRQPEMLRRHAAELAAI
jgi:tryptophan halogenase